MKTKQPELNKITALYERLSRDDEQSGDRIQQIDIYRVLGIVPIRDAEKSVNRRNKQQKKKSYLRQSDRLSQQ